MTTKQIIVRLTLAALVITACLYFKCCYQQNPTASRITAVQELQKSADHAQEFYLSEIKRLNMTSDSLLGVIASQRAELALTKRHTEGLSLRITRRISSPPEDTAAMLLDYNSLKTEVAEYIAESARKDLLYDQVMLGQETLIKTKDTALSVADRTIFSLVKITNESLAAQSLLEKKNTELTKMLKRKTAVNRFWKAATCILSGTVATLILIK